MFASLALQRHSDHAALLIMYPEQQLSCIFPLLPGVFHFVRPRSYSSGPVAGGVGRVTARQTDQQPDCTPGVLPFGFELPLESIYSMQIDLN